MPPPAASTSPLRRWTTRIPASRAGSAAASQSATTRERNARPAGASSVTAAPPVLPYQPMAEATRSAAGRGAAAARAVASALVGWTRLDRISAL
jgi:hypothetical protein